MTTYLKIGDFPGYELYFAPSMSKNGPQSQQKHRKVIIQLCLQEL